MPIQVLGQRSGGCSGCPLDKEARGLENPRMAPTGTDRPILYVLGEAPGRQEDEQGLPLVGKALSLVREYIPNELLAHTRWNNTVRCRPPGNRTPTREEQIHCSPHQVEDIERTKPLLILGLGNVPLGWATNQSGIADWRGLVCPVRVGSHTCWFVPMWHPSYVLRVKNDKRSGQAFLDTFARDFDRVLRDVLSGDLPEPYVPGVEEVDAGLDWVLSWDLDDVRSRLKRLRSLSVSQAVDIETNRIRPYHNDSKILSIAFGTWEYSVAIPIAHRESKWSEGQQKELWKIVREHLQDKACRFIAHQLSFELEWLSMPWACGESILHEVRWDDTMAQAECLRNQTKTGKSLNSRSVALLGVEEKALDGVDRDRLDTLPLPKVLRYNARDTKFTEAIDAIQLPRVRDQNLYPGYRQLVDRVPALTIAQQRGVLPNTDFAADKHRELLAESRSILEQMRALPVVKQLEISTGIAFNPGSQPQMVTLFRDILKVKEGWKEVDGERKYSVDEGVLGHVDHPAAKLLLKLRGLSKLDSTYVIGLCAPGAFPAEKSCGKLLHDDGLIHTQFDSLEARTGRLASQDPNIQNFPKRENPEIRNVVGVPPGHRMVAIDYGQIEARVIAIASACPVLGKAQWDHYDIHMDWAKILSKAFPDMFGRKYLSKVEDPAKALKKFRTDIKNEWTFPLFYGSIASSVARNLDVPLNKLSPYFDDFWHMFKAVKKWQDKLRRDYRRLGYVETLTGRRRYEPLSDNQILNSPVQGTASDIVVESMKTLARLSYELRRPQLAARINLHDDLTFYIPEETLQEDIATIAEVMATPAFDWIDVPLTVEISVGPSWGALQEIGVVESTEFGLPVRPDRLS